MSTLAAIQESLTSITELKELRFSGLRAPLGAYSAQVENFCQDSGCVTEPPWAISTKQRHWLDPFPRTRPAAVPH